MDDPPFFPRCGRGRHNRHHRRGPHHPHHPHGPLGHPHRPPGHPHHPHGPPGHPHHPHGPTGHPHGPHGHPHHPHHRPWFPPPHRRWPPHHFPPPMNPDSPDPPIEPLQQPILPQYQPPRNLSQSTEAAIQGLHVLQNQEQLKNPSHSTEAAAIQGLHVLQNQQPKSPSQPAIQGLLRTDHNQETEIQSHSTEAMQQLILQYRQQLILQHGPPQDTPRQLQPRAQPPEVRPQPERRGGFECDFVEEPPDSFPQWECPVCLFAAREPHQATCCGYSFCKGCIGRVKRDNKSCPTCNEREFQTFHNKGLERSLYGFKVHCTNRADGCGWNGELRELENHLEQVHN